MNINQKPILNSAYTVEKFDDEILLYTKEGTKAVYLNETAYAVWLLCKEEMKVEQIIAYLSEAFPDQSEQIKTDVIAALSALQSNNVIKLTDDK